MEFQVLQWFENIRLWLIGQICKQRKQCDDSLPEIIVVPGKILNPIYQLSHHFTMIIETISDTFLCQKVTDQIKDTLLYF